MNSDVKGMLIFNVRWHMTHELKSYEADEKIRFFFHALNLSQDPHFIFDSVDQFFIENLYLLTNSCRMRMLSLYHTIQTLERGKIFGTI